MTRGIEIARHSAIRRGLAFIYAAACKPEYFSEHGADFLCCFYCISNTSNDAEFRELARVMGRERARRWRQENSRVPAGATADDVATLVFGSDAATRMGVRDPEFRKQLQNRARGFSSHDYLYFDPAIEPPPTDVPMDCDCGAENARGRTTCRRCRSELSMMSAYWVWLVALTVTYAGERHGVRLGASFSDVLKWLPAMRPYPRPGRNEAASDFYWALYAVTHVIYTLNDYSAFKLQPSWLPDEYAFLRRNLTHPIETNDPEMLGEFLDSLKSFGLAETHPLIRKGMKYLLASQNEDGSWGNPTAEDIYERYHSTWTAIDGLREYAWRGQRPSAPTIPALVHVSLTNGKARHRP